MPSTFRGDSNFDTDLPFVTEQGSNSAGRFRRWSNGFVEQWIKWSTPGSSATLNLPIPFNEAKAPNSRNTAFIVTLGSSSGSATAYAYINDGFTSATQVQIFQGSASRGSVYIAGFLDD